MRRSNFGKVTLMLLVLCLMTACSSKTGKDGETTPQGSAQGDIVSVSKGYETSAVSVTLAKAEGAVDVEDKSGNALEPREGMFLYNGNRVMTNESSFAYLSLDDSKAAKLNQFSAMEVRKESKDLTLYLESGEMFFNVAKHLEDDEAMNIRTSTMVTGIRGTSGIVRVIDFYTTMIYVIDGEVVATVIDPVTGATKAALIKAGQVATTAVFKDQRNTDNNVSITIQSFSEGDVPAYVVQEVAQSANLQGRIIRGNVLNSPTLIGNYENALVRDSEENKVFLAQVKENEKAWNGQNDLLDEMFGFSAQVTSFSLTDPTLAQVQEALDNEQYDTVNVDGTFVFGDGSEGVAKLSSVRNVKRGWSMRNVDKDASEILTVPAGKYLNLNGKTAFGSTGAIKNYGIITNYGSIYIGGELENLEEGRFVNQGTVITPEATEECQHVAVTDRAVKATCTKDGYTKGSHCKICHAILEPQEVIPATGHKVITVAAKEATCTEDGNQAGTKCSACGEILSGCETIPALGHLERTVTGYAPVHNENEMRDGLTNGTVCDRCGQTLVPQQRIAAQHSWVLNENPDDEVGAYREPTCGEEGWRREICSVCGETREFIYQPTGNHHYMEISRTLDDCTKGGTRVMFCEECGSEITEPIEPHDHTPIVTQAAVPHTCEEDGMTAAISCEECGQILQSAQSDPAPGHHEFGANGTEYQYCAVCGEVNPKWQGNDPGTGGNGEGGNGEGGNP